MGRVLAVDPGSVRVGLAVSDPLRISAQPLDVVPSDTAVEEIARLCQELEVEEIIIGLPRTEAGVEGESAARARNLAAALEDRTGLEVTPIDERYTTRMAEQVMIDAGVRRRRRRQSVDKVAAAVLLQGYLDGGAR
ncbi:MAG TPA: Holliday junction resolvase RuvX [Acidimicrobiia bacterium]|jgi:putative Holliday junction resolvase|nr:Holliday junction resolvase RuvX [Acidimicrobiia bacterium]